MLSGDGSRRKRLKLVLQVTINLTHLLLTFFLIRGIQNLLQLARVSAGGPIGNGVNKMEMDLVPLLKLAVHPVSINIQHCVLLHFIFG